jgi:site-specific recombinase XerD
MNERGQGHLYQRGTTWWAQYFVNGRRVRESTGITNLREAQTFLNTRLGRAAEGKPILPRVDRVRYDELAADLRRHYETSGERELPEADKRLRPLKAFFTGYRAVDIGSADVTRYVEKRQALQLANGTINRELAMLKRVLRFAMQQDPPKLLRVPVVRLLKEAAPRAGFFEDARYAAVRAHLRPDLQVAVALAFTLGWRMQSEVLVLERRQVNLEAGTLSLDPGQTKSDEPRTVYLTPELRTAITGQLERVRALERDTGRIIPYLFPHLTNGRRYMKGDRIRDFRRAWLTACKAGKAPGMLRHDFRRTAVRNMVNDGTPEKVAMQITGHKTRAVFDRYHIVAPEDLKAAAARMAARDSHTLSHSVGEVAEMVRRKSR